MWEAKTGVTGPGLVSVTAEDITQRSIPRSALGRTPTTDYVMLVHPFPSLALFFPPPDSI